MKKRKIVKILYLLAFVFGVSSINVNANALELNGALTTLKPENEVKSGLTIRYYEEFKNQDLAKQYITTEYQSELRFLASQIGLDNIDIDNVEFQKYIASDLKFDDNTVDAEKIKELSVIIDIYENKSKNNEIEQLKNSLSLNNRMLSITTANIIESLDTIMPIDESEIVVGNMVTPIYSNGYNPTAAINYAHKWANSFNTTTYEEYENADCANFVSQCLLEAGMNAYYKEHWPLVGTIVKESNKNWYFYDENGRKAPSYSWTSAPYFYNHWTSRGATATSTYSNFAVGDPIACDWKGDGDIDHIVIVDGKSGNTTTTITYSGHTNARMNEPIKTLLDHYSGTKIYALKVANASN